MKNLTDFRKTVETGVDPRLLVFTTLRDWLEKFASPSQEMKIKTERH